MANQRSATHDTARRSWAVRLFGGFSTRMHVSQESPPRSLGDDRAPYSSNGTRLGVMARRLVADGRGVFVLLKEAASNIDDGETAGAWEVHDSQMALIPAGIVPVVHSNGGIGPVEVPAFYLDRTAVTNRQFQFFVNAGGYDDLEIWPREVWPSVMKLVDRGRRPGPRDWENGKFPAGKAEHPVVGVSWYEAAAYASWVGKRLPTAAEWQKASGWPEHLSGGSCQRFPWGDVFEPANANLGDGPGHTVPVDEYRFGATPNGVYQMSGNVWEWLVDRLDAIPARQDETFHGHKPMRRIVGGAYDTCFPAEATNQFITGQSELDRRENIGFRCAVSVARLRPRG
jgi:gamma-glutamyl hercynylcysteine S-oxide synthase